VKVPREGGRRLPLPRQSTDGRPSVDERIGLTTGFGPPALAAIGASALGASIYFALGVVTDRALGLTPVVYLAAGVFFVLTAMTYIEGNSLHPERGGASTLARYAFDELVSFIAGWAFLLDYLLVMAIGAFCISNYLTAFWGGADDPLISWLVAIAAVGWVAWSNIRGTSASRVRTLIRLTTLNITLLVILIVLGLSAD